MIGDWWIVLIVVGIGGHWCLDLARVHADRGIWVQHRLGSKRGCDARDASERGEGLACDDHGFKELRRVEDVFAENLDIL